MPDAVPAISLRHVTKSYRLFGSQRAQLMEVLGLHGLMRRRAEHREFRALSDVSLEVARGARVGIVGRNGAGKSTLLKVISRVLPPTSGRLEVQGHVAPILELGTGFDFELTGQENVFLNALLLGHGRREIEERFDAIVDFSGLGDFIRSPIRNYSSGMLARLGFAVLTGWTPDVLVLDEFLAVGDLHFVKKCQEWIANARAHGATLLLVSHDPDAIRDNCRRCIWLEGGRLRADGRPDEVLALYAESGEAAVDLAPGDATVSA